MIKWCSIPNHTYATLNLNDDRLFSIKNDNQIVGIFGVGLDRQLARKHLRKCKLIGEPILGERLDNGTWTGNLGLIQKSKAILYLNIATPFIDTTIEKWMFYSNPFVTEKYMIIQDIHKNVIAESNRDISSNVLSCFNFDLIILFFFAFANLLTFLMWILLKFLSNQTNSKKNTLFLGRKKRKKKKLLIRKRIKKFLINYLNVQFNLNYFKLNRIGILFYSFYIWFIQLVISNNITTSKVIVDRSILITDEHDALNSKKTVCFGENQLSIQMALYSNTNSLAKLYNQKNILSITIDELKLKKGERCIFKEEIWSKYIDMSEQLDDLFAVFSETLIYIFFTLIKSLKDKLVIFFNEKNPIAEISLKLIFKNEKNLRDLFNRICSYHIEFGISLNYRSSNTNPYAFLQSHAVYKTIEEFIDGNTKFTDLNMKSFKMLFIIYISFCLIILIINLLHYLLTKNILFLSKLKQII